MECGDDESDGEGEAQSNIHCGTVSSEPVTGEGVVELRKTKEENTEQCY